MKDRGRIIAAVAAAALAAGVGLIAPPAHAAATVLNKGIHATGTCTTAPVYDTTPTTSDCASGYASLPVGSSKNINAAFVGTGSSLRYKTGTTFTSWVVGPKWVNTPSTATEVWSARNETIVSTSNVTSTTVTVNWTEAAGATGYLVGRDGTDSANSGPWSITDPATARSRVFDKLIPGATYTFTVTPTGRTAKSVTVTLPGGTASPSPTPSVTPTPTPTPPPGGLPKVGKSGLPWNDTVFGHGIDPAAFEAWRGRPVDGVLMWPGRQTWNDMGWTPTRRPGDLLIWSIPPFPEGIGGSNAKVAAGQYDADIRALGAKYAAAGWNTDRTVIRLGWESNGTWYQWGWDRGGVQAYKDAYRRFVQQLRLGGMTNAKFNWALNKEPQGYNAGYSWTTAYPGDDVVDIIGIDSYDHYSPATNDATWNEEINLGSNPGLEDIAAFVREHGKQMSLDEWGVVHSANGGGDNPFYVRKMFEWVNANKEILAFVNTYDDDGAPSSFNHKLSDGGNPRAAAQYKLPYPQGWGR